MTTERFDIEVQDKVSRSIKSELESIGFAARQTHNSIKELKNDLGSLSVRTMASASRDAAKALKEQAAAANQAAAAMDREAQASARAVAQQERLASAVAKGVARSAGSGPAAAPLPQKTWDRDLTSSQTDFMRKMGSKPVKDMSDELGQMSPKIQKVSNEAKNLGQAFNTVGSSAKLNRQHLVNIGFQLQDIFVGLTTGQAPMTVFIQQGMQLGGIAAQAGIGLRGMAAAAGAILVPFLPLIAAVAIGAGAFALLNKSINDSTNIKELTKGMNLTAKQMRELDDVTVTWGDTAKAIFQVTGRAIWSAIGPSVTSTWKIMKDWLDWLGSAAYKSVNYLIGSMVGAYRAVMATWKQFPAGLGDVFFMGVNAAIDAINHLIKASVDGINGFIQQANSVLGSYGIELPQLTVPALDRVTNAYAGSAKQIADSWRKEVGQALGTDYLGSAYKAIRDQSNKNAQDRLHNQATDKGFLDPKNKTGKSPEEKRAEALDKLKRSLESELAVASRYGVEAEKLNKFEEINNGLLDKKIHLTNDEVKWIKDKINAIIEAQRVQVQLNKIESEALGPQREYEATQKAIAIALHDGIIKQDEANRRLNLAKTAYEDTLDPLRKYNEELQRQNEDLTLYGKNLQDVQRAREMFDKAVAAGVTNRDSGSVKDYLGQASDENKKKDINSAFESIDPKSNEDPTDPSFILKNYKEMYSQLAAMREDDYTSEAQLADRKKNLDAALTQARLDQASQMFGALATLSTSKNKELAAIGKAAAIAEATIDGISAVQKALKSPPGWPFNAPSVIAVGLMSAVNVAKIAGIGFETGGYTGTGANNSIKGLVHANEFVMDAQATRRIGLPALEAARATGSLAAPSANDNSRGNIRIVQGPGTYVEAQERSDGEIEVIAERVAKRVAPRAVADDLRGNPNGHTSKAMGQVFGVRRDR